MKFAILFSILFLVCGLSATINVGVILPLTGNASIDGVVARRTLVLVHSIFNRVENYDINIIIKNNQSNPIIDKQETLNLIQGHDVKAIIGWIYSSHAFGGTPVAEKHRIPGVCIYATNPLITQGKSYISRVVFDDNFQGSVAASYVYHKLKIKNIAVVRDISQEYSIGLASIFESRFRNLGGRIIKTYNINSQMQDEEHYIRMTANEIIKSGIKSLYMPIYSNEIALFLKELKKQDKNILFFASDAAGFVSDFLKDESLSNGLYYTDQYFVNYKYKNSMAKTFDNEYYKKYGYFPKDVVDYMVFDAYYLVYNAIKSCIENNEKPTPEKINYYIRHIKDLMTPTGRLTIDPDTGNALKSIYILKYSDGKDVFVDKIPYIARGGGE